MTQNLTAAHRIERLLEKHPKGFDLSLERISRLLEALGNPQDKLPPIIHIAGTNGKGSATAFARALLEAEGLAVHVHTSPHLVNWHERYRLGRKGETGQLVDDATLSDAVARVTEANGEHMITVFEILTAVTFVLFAEHPADAVILEVGLGGRFDATNVITKPAVSLIMPVSLDHQSYLGDKVEIIAAEKAGIIKRGCPVVIGYQSSDDARQVMIDIADRLRCAVSVFGQDFLAYQEHGRMVYQDESGLIDLPLPRLPGRHQIANAAAAIKAVREAGFALSDQAVEKAMTSVTWPARMQRLTQGDLIRFAPEKAEIWLDGGHNPGAGVVIAEALAELEERDPRPLYLITGMINTKDPVGYFEAFTGMARQVYTVAISSSDSGIDHETLADAARRAGLEALPVASVADGLKAIKEQVKDEVIAPRILIGGSLYLAGDVLAANNTPPQ
ncbi:bifunctional folylpolyglutamate synthase/dihydrofolate synthase [Pseudochrobactrum asaccharolyticum]|jgi:dihydrofolate synthase/folylpolyglutamate synthase|uniref:tetrahydrofolate synthase n=1 Tax=Pseudochrobactrum asaccharolyticum TaxID=354351 RepID=A0A366E5Y5_9HYPH|nr:folylpolyglutamate synthase/dihydrofolate synthase family protein [Pseudochrobactrum asaccharolyticum]MDR0251989.1 bifunctional folylpolyglutamate synthase/dihydrofolate synthase [Brucellaceae bacterium]RBO97801.1 dihydrofolate synthase/folylpolyglutamate synthase [Pseudochrobactrum asaccharolyticum]